MNNNNITSKKISLDAFIEYANNLYYGNDIQPLGAKGDFITAPEISQMFGEIVGLWCIDMWQQISPNQMINIVELGPGRGALMRNLLKIFVQYVNSYNHDVNNKTSPATSLPKKLPIHLYLMDINPKCIDEQKQILKNFDLASVQWINDITEINKDYPTLIIANEFFDVLPIKQYVKLANNWQETFVSMEQKPCYSFEPVTTETALRLNNKYIFAENGGCAEESPASLELMEKIVTHIKNTQGAALIIDYGYNVPPYTRQPFQYNSTLQAIKEHKFSNPLENIGLSDLTSHVDFYALAEHAQKLGILNIIIDSQSTFLHQYGIKTRLSLLQKNNPKYFNVLDNQYRRLTSADQMGELFKVLSIRY